MRRTFLAGLTSAAVMIGMGLGSSPAWAGGWRDCLCGGYAGYLPAPVPPSYYAPPIYYAAPAYAPPAYYAPPPGYYVQPGPYGAYAPPPYYGYRAGPPYPYYGYGYGGWRRW